MQAINKHVSCAFLLLFVLLLTQSWGVVLMVVTQLTKMLNSKSYPMKLLNGDLKGTLFGVHKPTH